MPRSRPQPQQPSRLQPLAGCVRVLVAQRAQRGLEKKKPRIAARPAFKLLCTGARSWTRTNDPLINSRRVQNALRALN
ncbi:hypothetical protein PRA13_09295 [Xylella fastidiosa]|uniref:hypothetical protein n=1 Tax=Xylella fastidiosa TaxID=2371 RepID=UPI000FFED413|nr:hypothetical protein [Xylella fastidiosa]MDC7963988.1 hypothetical protein [Xylella fastidiosa]